MKRKRQDPFEPKVYLPNIRHPEYLTRAWEYFAEQHAKKLLKKKGLGNRPVLGLGAVALFYRSEIEGARVYSDEKDKYVIEAVKLFGDHPIELSVSLNPLRFSQGAERLGAAVCRVLGNLRNQVLTENYEARQKAKKRLKKIVRGILPDARGKKRNTADPLLVQEFYWKELFRLYHIQNGLRASGKNPSQKVKAASQNFDMPIEQIRDLWKLDEDAQPTVRPVRIKEMARILTARYFRITQHRLSNILAS